MGEKIDEQAEHLDNIVPLEVIHMNKGVPDLQTLPTLTEQQLANAEKEANPQEVIQTRTAGLSSTANVFNLSPIVPNSKNNNITLEPPSNIEEKERKTLNDPQVEELRRAISDLKSFPAVILSLPHSKSDYGTESRQLILTKEVRSIKFNKQSNKYLVEFSTRYYASEVVTFNASEVSSIIEQGKKVRELAKLKTTWDDLTQAIDFFLQNPKSLSSKASENKKEDGADHHTIEYSTEDEDFDPESRKSKDPLSQLRQKIIYRDNSSSYGSISIQKTPSTEVPDDLKLLFEYFPIDHYSMDCYISLEKTNLNSIIFNVPLSRSNFRPSVTQLPHNILIKIDLEIAQTLIKKHQAAKEKNEAKTQDTPIGIQVQVSGEDNNDNITPQTQALLHSPQHNQRDQEGEEGDEEEFTAGCKSQIVLFLLGLIAITTLTIGTCILAHCDPIIDGINNVNEAGGLNISTSDWAAISMIVPTALYLIILKVSFNKDIQQDKPRGTTLVSFFQPKFLTDKFCCNLNLLNPSNKF